MVIMSSLAAAVQGMDEAVINGAQIIYPKQFGIGSGSRELFLWLTTYSLIVFWVTISS
jgi:hypothetical protein